jgi:hypothetical protein
MQIPKAKLRRYDKSLEGIIGKLGAKDSSINYLQVNLPIKDLDLLGLVSEIPGSEKWPIRQLFQRDIDTERVKSDLIPYFLDSAMSKFFNPLTIAVLPFDHTGSVNSVSSEVSCDPEADQNEFFTKAFALDGYYRVSSGSGAQWATIEWDSSRVKLIAIDGQHRLSALKRIHAMYLQDPSNPRLVEADFSNWVIPIVLVTVGHKEHGGISSSALLERTRNIFVTINKQARAPSRTRTILLNDFSVLAVVTQETLDSCGQYELSLGLFNWRETRDEDRPSESAHLLGVDELEDLFKEYLIGEDENSNLGLVLSPEQMQSLFWGDKVLVASASSEIASQRDEIKSQFRETVLPAFFHILKYAKPYSEYVKYVSGIESTLDDDVKQHAWSRLVYGSDFAPNLIETEVVKEKIRILEGCTKEKGKLGELFGKAIGLRGLYSGFGQYFAEYCSRVAVESWRDVAIVFLENFNLLYEKKLFSSHLPAHIVFDHGGIVVNYRIDSVNKALGALIAYATMKISFERDSYDFSDLSETLNKTLISGYKKEHRKDVKEELSGKSSKAINEEISARANVSAIEAMAKLDKFLRRSERKA